MQPNTSKCVPFCLLALTYLLFCPKEAIAIPVGYSVSLYSKNPRFVEIVIDTTKLPANISIANVVVSVNFFSKGRKMLGTSGFSFTDDKILPTIGRRPDLIARIFPHQFPLAVAARLHDLTGIPYQNDGGGRNPASDKLSELSARNRELEDEIITLRHTIDSPKTTDVDKFQGTRKLKSVLSELHHNVSLINLINRRIEQQHQKRKQFEERMQQPPTALSGGSIAARNLSILGTIPHD